MKGKNGWKASRELRQYEVVPQDRSHSAKGRATAWSGVVFNAGVIRDCGHYHERRREAMKCARSWARKLNSNAGARP